MFNIIDRFLVRQYKILKRKKDILLLYLLRPVAQLGVIADTISLLGLISGSFAAISLHYSRSLFFLFWLLTRIIDSIDGTISRLNKKKIFLNVNMDSLCDTIFSLMLFVSLVPIAGYLWPILAVVTYLVHVQFDLKTKGESILAPKSDYAQICFLFGLFQEGLIVQVIYSVFAFILRRILNRGKLDQ